MRKRWVKKFFIFFKQKTNFTFYNSKILKFISAKKRFFSKLEKF